MAMRKRGHSAFIADYNTMPQYDTLGSGAPTQVSTRPPAAYSIRAANLTVYSQTMVALPPMPGQWDTIYVPGDVIDSASTAPASLFATARRLALTFTNIKAFFNVTCRILDRYTRHQIIQAVPVARPDGSRKKILLDAGTLDENSKLRSFHDDANATNRAYTKGRESSPETVFLDDVWRPATAWKGTQHTRSSAPYQKPTRGRPVVDRMDKSPVTAHDLHNSPSPITKRLAQSTNHATDARTNANNGISPSTPRFERSTMHPTEDMDADTDMDDTLDTLNSIDLQECFQSTPRPPKNAVLNETRSTPIKTLAQVRQDIWPVVDKFGMSRFVSPSPNQRVSPKSRVVTPTRANQVAQGTGFPKGPYKAPHPRLQALRTSNATHTDRKLNARNASDNAYQQIYLKSTAFKNEATVIAQKARKESEDYKSQHQARVEDALAQEKEICEPRGRDLSSLGDEAQFLSSTIEYDDDGIPTVADYSNDLSFLPDAPQEKTAQKSGKTKDYTKDDAASYLLDPSVPYIKISPWEQSYEPWDHVDETSLSIEVIEDFKEKLKDSAPAVQPPPPVAAPLPPAPLVASLTDEEEERLRAAVKQTDNGALSLNLVEDLLNTHDFKTLLPLLFQGDKSAWLNDNIINEYLKVLINHEKAKVGYVHNRNGPGPAPPVHAFTSQWYATMLNKPETVKRWSIRVNLSGTQLLNTNLLLFPICYQGHWRLLAIKPRDRTIQYIDSMYMAQDEVIETAKDWLKLELGDAYVDSEWQVLNQYASTKQKNGRDCGVFTCLNALTLLRNESFDRVISDNGMEAARKRIAVTLLGKQQTGELN
jgi:hypothetical protein